MSAYIYKWIEGEKNLKDYCRKRFNELPRFIETIGSVGTEGAKIWLIYKRKLDGGYAEMYLLFMPHEKGTIYDIGELSKMTYEDIRLDRTALLRK